ncbi:MAG: hypothetical protein OXI37_04760 [Gammaproteobacteria bacterium]|nr:hypothetical protein [Gammaproteobacteria bacterium]
MVDLTEIKGFTAEATMYAAVEGNTRVQVDFKDISSDATVCQTWVYLPLEFKQANTDREKTNKLAVAAAYGLIELILKSKK